MTLKSPDFGTGIMFSIDHWFGLFLLRRASLQNSRIISSMLHLLMTSGGMPSSPKLLPSLTALLALWYSSQSKASVLIGNSGNIIGITSSSSNTSGGFPRRFLKWLYQLPILSSLVFPYYLPALDFFLLLTSFIRLQAFWYFWFTLAFSNSFNFLSRYSSFAKLYASSNFSLLCSNSRCMSLVFSRTCLSLTSPGGGGRSHWQMVYGDAKRFWGAFS